MFINARWISLDWSVVEKSVKFIILKRNISFDSWRNLVKEGSWI